LEGFGAITFLTAPLLVDSEESAPEEDALDFEAPDFEVEAPDVEGTAADFFLVRAGKPPSRKAPEN